MRPEPTLDVARTGAALIDQGRGTQEDPRRAEPALRRPGSHERVNELGATGGVETLLATLRDRLGVRGPKDGCSPQGQCGCCTVLVDGQPRVACVTPTRRVAGREVTTVDGLPEDERLAWGEAFAATGGSQCGFCTPGIVVRLAALRAKGVAPDDASAVERALLAHLCRCTGWRTIVEAYAAFGRPPVERDLDAASRRATIEGGVHQAVGPHVALGAGGFADDTAPLDAVILDPGPRVQGRRTTIPLTHPLELPPGDWDVTLRTTWVEPAYLETDASWCTPGGEPADPVANGGAFGGKTASPAPRMAREAADERGTTVRVRLSREDTVRLGAKRPPIAAGVRRDGTGVVRVVRTPGVANAIARVAPALTVEEVEVAGPPTSVAVRGAGWVEAAVLLAAARGDRPVTITSPAGGVATAEVGPDGIHVRVACGAPLDEVVLRSYCVGAAHMALGWVTSEAIRVDEEGVPHDLTIRSFGIVRPTEMPAVHVTIDPSDAEPVNGSDAVFAAVAAAVWLDEGLPPAWPTRRGGTG